MVTEEDIRFLKRCEDLGSEAAANGNPAVGAVIVRNGVLLSEAAEAGKSKNDITYHAELEALRIAVAELKINDLSDCVMYTSHEPCVMCAYAIRFYRIRKVVFQHYVSHLGSISSALPLLTTHSVPDSWSKPPEIIHIPSGKHHGNI